MADGYPAVWKSNDNLELFLAMYGISTYLF